MMMFDFTDAAPMLSMEAPNKPRVIDNIVLQELKSLGVRPGIFSVETFIDLNEWRGKRDAIMSSSAWDNVGMKMYLFPITAGNNSQTMNLPTSHSLLDLTYLSQEQKNGAQLHVTQFANGPAIITLGNILHDQRERFRPIILFGRSWHKCAPTETDTGPSVNDYVSCSAIDISDDGIPRYTGVPPGIFHFGSNIYGSLKKYTTTAFTLTYNLTEGVTTGKVMATFPALIFNLRIIDANALRNAIDQALMNSTFN